MRRFLQLAISLATALASLVPVAGAHPSDTPSLSASSRVVSFGQTLTIEGAVPGAAAGQPVQIIGAVCGFTGLVPVGETKTSAGGKYRYAMQPMLNATLYAETASGEKSRGARVQIKPTVQLRRVTKSIFGVDVTVGNGAWFAKPVILQRFLPATKSWQALATGTLKANSDPEAIAAVSSATIHASVKAGTQLRALVPQTTLGPCYLSAASATFTAN
jgi:hypothetical protein